MLYLDYSYYIYSIFKWESDFKICFYCINAEWISEMSYFKCFWQRLFFTPQSWPLQSTHDVPPPTALLTSDPGIEGNAHTAVGVVRFHGNFPCTPGTMTGAEGGMGR